MNVVSKIWGRLLSSENMSEEDEQVKELERLMERNSSKLSARIDKETEEIFSRYCECAAEYRELMNEQAFFDGFSLGARIIAEAMIHAEKVT